MVRLSSFTGEVLFTFVIPANLIFACKVVVLALGELIFSFSGSAPINFVDRIHRVNHYAKLVACYRLS